MEEFLPIVLGSDLNTYSIAREIYEAYEIKPVVATSMILLPCIDSQIINIYKKENFSKDSEVFKEVLDRNYKDLSYPNEVFIKPDNDVFYKSLDFEGQQKGYHSKSIDETIKILERIFNAGYDYNILVQEFVVGGDGSEYTIEGYRSENTISMAMSKNILLDKRVEWIGNFVAKVDSEEKILFDYARDIVKTLGVYGLFNIDFKKDTRTGKFYAFEINLRQGRSHYFATLNGVNTSKLAIEDKIFGREEEIIGDKSFRYYNLDLAQTIDNLEDGLRDEFEKNKRKNNSTNPLVYEKDWNLRRKIKINKYLNKLSKETFAIKEI